MSQKSELVPKRRFKEFENAEDWEQRKLDDIADVTKLAGFEFTKYVTYQESGSIIALRGLNVKNGNIILDDVKYIDKSDFSKLNRSKLFENDILLTYVGTVGQVAVVTENDKYYLAPNVARIRVSDKINPFFVSQMMNAEKFYKRIIFPLIATSSQPALSMENVRKFILVLPKKTEQEKIALFFNQIDDTITLHKRKLDKLKNLKQSYLYQMFPQNGQKIPTLRFSGFSGDWGVHKLKDMASLMNGYAFKSENYVSNGIYKILTISNVTGQRYTDMNETHSVDYLPSNIQSYQILQQGDVLISLTGNVGRVSIVNEENCLLNQRVGLLKINSNVNQEYIYQCLNNKKFEEKMIKSGQGAAQLNISKNDIEEYEILLPSKKEQQKIGKYFKQLDETIEVQEQELEKLKNLKEAYLNEMFV
ncbi:restriction endonuclease subunit S [Aerococcus urinaeequi]|uniref:restriction endonuclease subunit S n=1 Tax=Aerococcus urinaeequi TaxID=51665 RepID=UPI003D6B928E